MTETELAELLHHCPTLYHMAKRGSWLSIQRHGLLSTSALLDLFGVTGTERDTIERRHRPAGIPLRHPAHGQATVRDQKPMSDGALRRCLQRGMEPADWYELLNGRVFFWLTRARLLKLLGGKEYREAEHDVLEIDAAALVEAYREKITLSPINSGAPYYANPIPRGPDTFQTIAGFNYGDRRRRNPVSKCVVELTVRYAVPDTARFVRRVVSMQGDKETGTLFTG